MAIGMGKRILAPGKLATFFVRAASEVSEQSTAALFAGRGHRVKQALGLWVPRLAGSVYHRQVQYICARPLPAPPTAPCGQTDNQSAIRCVIVESPESLRTLALDLEGPLPLEKLLKRLAGGCIVFLAYSNASHNRKTFAGYSIRQRGVFSALGRKKDVSNEILFSHYVEVRPEFRGHKIAELLSRAADLYGPKRGLKKIITVVSPSNHPSLRHLERNGYRMAGKVERISILRGLYIWETPWHSIEKAIAG